MSRPAQTCSWPPPSAAARSPSAWPRSSSRASVALDPTLPAPNGSGGANGIVKVTQPVIDGLSEQSAFGNTVTINLIDQTPGSATFGQVIGTGSTNAAGRFAVQINAGVFKADGSTNGLKKIGVQAVNQSGTLGNIATLSFTLSVPQLTKPSIALLSADDSGAKNDNITNVKQPHFVGVTSPGPGVSVDLIDTDGDISGAAGSVLGTVSANNLGNYIIQVPSTLTDGVYHVQVRARDISGNMSLSSVLTLQIISTPPTTVPTIAMSSADDTGVKGDGITALRRPRLTGKAVPGGFTQIVQDQFIPDNGTSLVSNIVVPFDGGQFVIADLNVQLDITHPRDSDLTIVLIDPQGGQHPLFAGVGGSGKNFTGTILDDQAAKPITDPSAERPSASRTRHPVSRSSHSTARRSRASGGCRLPTTSRVQAAWPRSIPGRSSPHPRRAQRKPSARPSTCWPPPLPTRTAIT